MKTRNPACRHTSAKKYFCFDKDDARRSSRVEVAVSAPCGAGPGSVPSRLRSHEKSGRVSLYLFNSQRLPGYEQVVKSHALLSRAARTKAGSLEILRLTAWLCSQFHARPASESSSTSMEVDMTKFPLPASTFPTLELPQKDVDEIEALSSLLVERTLIQYHEHEVVRRGVVDTTRWKRVAQRQDIKVFKERASATTNSAWSEDITTNSCGNTTPMLMCVGTIPGDLFDVMYGVLNPTTEAMRIKFAHDEGGLLDGRVLATLIKPSVEDPLRSLTLRWSVKGGPLLMTPVVRNRDVVYMESTGIAYTKSGERIGYELLHSVEVPGVPEFLEHQIVRAELSFCYIYRQKTPEIVDVFMRGILNPRGNVPSYVGVISTAEALVAVSANAHCAEMKKLTWLLRTSKADPPSTLPDTSHCAVCLQATRLLNLKSMMKYSCAVCSEQVCSKCCVTRKLNYISPLNFSEVLQTKFPFCVRCVERALGKSAIEIATEEVDDPNVFGMPFGAMVDILSAPTSFSSTSSMTARTAP